MNEVLTLEDNMTSMKILTLEFKPTSEISTIHSGAFVLVIT